MAEADAHILSEGEGREENNVSIETYQWAQIHQLNIARMSNLMALVRMEKKYKKLDIRNKKVNKNVMELDKS